MKNENKPMKPEKKIFSSGSSLGYKYKARLKTKEQRQKVGWYQPES